MLFRSQGNFATTDGAFDFAINGKGFFMIEQPDGSIAYTRNGNFQLSVNTSGGLTLSTSDGYAVLDSTGNPITFDANVDTTKLTFDNYGNIKYVDATGNAQNLGIAIGIAQYNNPAGLEKMGDSYFKESVASGTPRIEGQDANLQRSVVKNGYLESSSVQAVEDRKSVV